MGSTIRHPYQLGAILHQRTGVFHVVRRVDCSAEYGMSVATLAYLERYGVCATCHRSMTPNDAHEACFGPSRGWVGNLTASTAVLLVQTDSQDARNLQRLRSMDQPLAATMRRRRNIEAAGGELTKKMSMRYAWLKGRDATTVSIHSQLPDYVVSNVIIWCLWFMADRGAFKISSSRAAAATD